MTALGTTIQPHHVRCVGGDILCGRVWLTPTQAQQLLTIWREEREAAYAAGDEASWRIAASLQKAIRRAIESAEIWGRASRGHSSPDRRSNVCAAQEPLSVLRPASVRSRLEGAR